MREIPPIYNWWFMCNFAESKLAECQASDPERTKWASMPPVYDWWWVASFWQLKHNMSKTLRTKVQWLVSEFANEAHSHVTRVFEHLKNVRIFDDHRKSYDFRDARKSLACFELKCQSVRLCDFRHIKKLKIDIWSLFTLKCLQSAF